MTTYRKYRREITDSKLKTIKTRHKIHLQNNGRYATYHRKSDGYRKLILEVEDDKVIIVSFIDTPEIPRIRFKNE